MGLPTVLISPLARIITHPDQLRLSYFFAGRNSLLALSCSFLDGTRFHFFSSALADDLLLAIDHKERVDLRGAGTKPRASEFSVRVEPDSVVLGSPACLGVGSMRDSMKGASKSSRNLLRLGSMAVGSEVVFLAEAIADLSDSDG